MWWNGYGMVRLATNNIIILMEEQLRPFTISIIILKLHIQCILLHVSFDHVTRISVNIYSMKVEM